MPGPAGERGPSVGAVAEMVLAAVLCAAAVTEVLAAHTWPDGRILGVAAAAAITLPLALSRRRPTTAAVVTFAAVAGQALLARTPQSIAEFVGLAVMVFVATLRVRRGRPWALTLGTAAVALAVVRSEQDVVLGDYLFSGIVLVAPFLVGLVVRKRRADTAAARERERAAVEHRRDLAALAVRDERARVARELHDVVAHALSVVVVQAVGGRAVLGTDPDRSAEAFATIGATASQALAELHRLVGALQAVDGADHDPPGLDRLSELVELARSAGLKTTLLESGRRTPLPAGVELSAYRIVQEALTNALRYAGRTEASVELHHDSGLRLRVTNGAGAAGAAAPAVLVGGGNGIIGMRERAALCGGRLEAGPTADGGFLVEATLPGGVR